MVLALRREEAGLFDRVGAGGGQEGLAPHGEFLASENVPEMKTAYVTSRKKNFLVQLKSSRSSYNYTAVHFSCMLGQCRGSRA